MLNHLNHQHTTVKFKIEMEVNNTNNLLDLKMLRNNNSSEFMFNRKPTHTDLVILRYTKPPTVKQNVISVHGVHQAIKIQFVPPGICQRKECN